MKAVVITGVSTGIGHGTAAEFCRRGYKVFGSVRQPAQAEALQTEFGERFVPLLFDVTDRAAIDAAAEQVSRALGDRGLDGLVNNAGISIAGPLHLQPPEIVRHSLEVN